LSPKRRICERATQRKNDIRCWPLRGVASLRVGLRRYGETVKGQCQRLAQLSVAAQVEAEAKRGNAAKRRMKIDQSTSTFNHQGGGRRKVRCASASATTVTASREKTRKTLHRDKIRAN
jgi:hypothetical protein